LETQKRISDFIVAYDSHCAAVTPHKTWRKEQWGSLDV